MVHSAPKSRSRRAPGERLLAPLLAAAVWLGASQAGSTPPQDPDPALTPSVAYQDMRARLAQDELIYFLLPDRFDNADPANDRGGLEGGRLVSGFDPEDAEFYHGGDLSGVIRRLDYIQGLGATAIWLAPIFKNKPVQGEPGRETAAAHGYWVVDFTDVDPHFGDRETFGALVKAAHQRGMKVYMDIITNHTADVIRYRECPDNDCVYRSRADYPYSRRGGPDGTPINDGFDGTDFSRLTRPDYAYTPYVPEAERTVKVPDWLNDPIHYHNRGETTFRGESSLDGDFAGLDDIFTENPVVVQGFIDIYGAWIDAFGIDGFRIDTARHVNPEFWQAFVPAMLERARARGIPNFHIFGEVYDHDPAVLAQYTRVDGFPSVLDFGFQSVATDVANGLKAPDALARLYRADSLYEGGEMAALGLPTFLGNHDMGRIAGFIRKAHPSAADSEIVARTRLAHALMMFTRGTPVLYYGDEQGFAGEGGYASARASLFASQTQIYADQPRIGGPAEPFSTRHPLYQAIADMAQLRSADRRLRQGRQIVRAAAETPGLFAISRVLPGMAGETLVVFNTSTETLSSSIEIETSSDNWTPVRGPCPASSSAPGTIRVNVPGLDYVICSSQGPAA